MAQMVCFFYIYSYVRQNNMTRSWFLFDYGIPYHTIQTQNTIVMNPQKLPEQKLLEPVQCIHNIVHYTHTRFTKYRLTIRPIFVHSLKC